MTRSIPDTVIRELEREIEFPAWQVGVDFLNQKTKARARFRSCEPGRLCEGLICPGSQTTDPTGFPMCGS